MHYLLQRTGGKILLFFCTVFFLGGCVATQPEVTQSDRFIKSDSAVSDGGALEQTYLVGGELPAPVAETIDKNQLSPGKSKVARVDFSPKQAGTQTGTDANDVAFGKSIVEPAPLLLSDIAPVQIENTVIASGSNEERLVINMENANLYDVVLFFIKQLNLNCIIEPNIGGTITIHTAGELNKKDLLPLFYQILEANGLTAVQEGKFYRIVTAADVSRADLPLVRNGSGGRGNYGMLLQIIPLKHIASDEMVKILTPFISEQGSLISHVDSNSLLLVDSYRNVQKVLKLVRSFDVDIFTKIGHRFYKIEYVESGGVAKTLSDILTFFDDKKSKIKIINLEKLNSLLVLSDSESVFDKITEMLVEFDKESNDVESHIYLYFLKNSQSEDMAGILNSIFSRSNGQEDKQIPKNTKESTEKPKGQNPFAVEKKVQPVKRVRRTTSSDYGSGALRGEVKIIEDTIRNALVIDAIPSDYLVVERILKRLDILPRQVLISVTIADVQLDDDMKLGVEWTFKHSSASDNPSDLFYTINTGNAGLGFVVGETLKWDATLSALADKKKVDIVATPSVLASDNISASIDISTEIPVASAQIEYDDNNTNKTQTNIQYRNTGIILNVTPHINEYGLVSMEINQEVSEQSTAVKVGNASYPSFFKRSVSTTLTVNSGQTIAIGGLIREVKTKANRGVPFLSDIPLIGWLFGTQSTESSKSELIILITPKVVATPDDIDAVTAEFAAKLHYDMPIQHE